MSQVGGAQGVSPHPLEDAVVPSTEVTRGCQGELSLVSYEDNKPLIGQYIVRK